MKTKGKKVSKRATKTAAKSAAKSTATEAGRIPLKKICQDLGLDPKRSRVKLRRAWRRVDEKGKTEGNVAFHAKGGRWDLTPSEAKEVRAILAG